jgi:hypothetical protein
VELLHNQTLGEKLGAAGYAFVRAHYDWSVIIPTLEKLHAELIPTR